MIDHQVPAMNLGDLNKEPPQKATNTRNSVLQDVPAEQSEFPAQNFVLFSPFCHQAHWLAFVYRQGSPVVHYFDSLSTRVADDYRTRFTEMLTQVIGTEMKLEFKRIRTSRQQNDNDCGFCMLLTLIKLLRRDKCSQVQFTQQEVDGLRLWLFSYFVTWAEARPRAQADSGLASAQIDENGVVDID